MQLLLHPGRHQLNSVLSGNTTSKSLVCQVIVPKIIGRKRKGSLVDSEAEDLESHQMTEKQRLMQSLKDQPEACDFKIIGQYNRVHKFRTMPDFAYSQQSNNFMRSFNDTIGTFKYEKLKEFQLHGNEEYKPDADLIPPPVFSPHVIPFNYVYQQNTSVKVVVGDDGEVTTLNESTFQRSVVSRVAIDIDQVPTEPPLSVTPIDLQPATSQILIQKLRALFTERPIWSRRAVYHQLEQAQSLSGLKWLFQYVGYEFGAGPWAMTVIRYGVDPRADPEFRMYQSITLHFEPQARHHPTTPGKGNRGGARQAPKKVNHLDENGVPGYIFTGKSLVLDGKTWQVCDVQDPLIRAIFSTENLRSECDMDSDGWFKNGTWAKAKVIFRYKARALLNGDNSWAEDDFVRAAEMPDEFNPTLKDLPVDTTGWSRRAILVAFTIKHGSLTFGRNRSQWASHDASEAVMQALRKHDSKDSGEQADSDENLAELFQDDQDLLRDESMSDVMDGSEEEDVEEDIGEEEEEDAGVGD